MLLLVSAALLILMLLYPPYHVVTSYGQFNASYGWLFAPPGTSSQFLSRATVNVGLLAAQLIVVIIATAFGYIALAPQQHPEPSVANPNEAAQRLLDGILESDVPAMQAALSLAISAELSRRR